MVPIDRSQVPLRVILGCCCLPVCLGDVSLGAPAYETTIAEQAPSEAAMAESLDAYAPEEIEPVAFSALSSAEQTAVAGALDAPNRIYGESRR
jgi:hypothetical protein